MSVVTIGDRLRLLRAAKGVSQRETARRAGVEAMTLTRIESGEREPRRATLGFLAQALDVKPEALSDDAECFIELGRLMSVPVRVQRFTPYQEEALSLMDRAGPDKGASAVEILRGLLGLMEQR